MSKKADAIKAWLKTKFPGDAQVEISSLRKASSGWANETLLFDFHHTTNGFPCVDKLVLRCMTSQGPPFFPEYDLHGQYQIMECLGGTRLPVPKTYWFEGDPNYLGGAFYVMGMIEGDTASDYPPGMHGQGLFFDASPEKRRALWLATVDVMAEIHALDWKKYGLTCVGNPQDGRGALVAQLDQWERFYRWSTSETVSAVERAITWLRSHLYEPSRIGLCWGDARPGNIIFQGVTPAAVLDWEIAHIGPGEDDLVYLIQSDLAMICMFGTTRLKGLPNTEETIAYYEEKVGQKAENLRYHMIFQNLKLAIMCNLGAKAYAAGGMDVQLNIHDNWQTRTLDELLSQPD